VLPYFQDRGWQVGCWTRPWAQYDYRTGFDAVAEAGFRYVALTGAKTRSGRVISLESSIEEARQVGEEARRRGLTITNVYGGDVALEKGTSGLRKMIDRCAAAGGWSVLLASMGDEKTYEACCRTVAECGDYATENKVAIVLKPHGGTTGTGPQLRDAFRRVGRPCFTIMYDPGNILYYSGGKLDPVKDCDAVLGAVTGVSVKDFRPPKEVMLTPGTGQIDFAALMKRLVSGGMTHGPLMIETLTPGDLKQTLQEARKAKEFVERIVAHG
jgi:sugar phosphate isomerase/epimerase